ncbi:hypothetical protein TNCV_326871 [Trichonephila clavipes]|nr:hypothetical protein TNCV_326871 [Trichonephila clavipes]
MKWEKLLTLIWEWKRKLLLCKAYLEDEGFICDALATMIEDRMEKDIGRENRKKIEEYRKKVERRLERKQELELARIEARWETESETRIREASHREEKRRKPDSRLRRKPKQWRKSGRWKKERRLVEEQMRHVQEEHKMSMKTEVLTRRK